MLVLMFMFVFVFVLMAMAISFPLVVIGSAEDAAHRQVDDGKGRKEKEEMVAFHRGLPRWRRKKRTTAMHNGMDFSKS
jgi:hypothetical protein